MMTAYSLSFLRNNTIKTIALCLSLAVYFALVVIAATLHRSIPEIAQLPLQQIGVQTIVQKTGEIPGQMVGAIFPHSNAPISQAQFSQLSKLPFVVEADMGLYFWYFDAAYFKAALGVSQEKKILTGILEKNLTKGRVQLGNKNIVITAAFSGKHGLEVGDFLDLGTRHFLVSGVLQANISGNIIPADIYMSLADALEVVRDSIEMQNTYTLDKADFGNVVLLKGDPGWGGDKGKRIKGLDKQFLVFSEKTFTEEITGQLGLVSATGRVLFFVLGLVLCLAFGLLTFFSLKSREQEIAILRMIGWRIRDLEIQFIGENLLLLGGSILLGSGFSVAGLFLLGRQTVSLELPWDISARPHFLPEENSIERIVSASLPVHFDATILAATAIGFLVLSLAVSYFCFRRINKIRPLELNR